MNIEQVNKLISLVLGVIIIVLGYFLYHAIVDPYQEVLEKERMTEHVRTRMSQIRDGLVRYEAQNDSFPENLDSLISWVQRDSLMQTMADSIFKDPYSNTFNQDSLLHSPRTGKRFHYVLVDTIRPSIYMLSDPDTDDVIGDTVKTTKLNAASWE